MILSIQMPHNKSISHQKRPRMIEKHPNQVDIVLGDAAQRDKLLGLVWSEMFNHDGNIQYLNLLAELKMRADMDVQQADALNTLLKNYSQAMKMLFYLFNKMAPLQIYLTISIWQPQPFVVPMP